VKSKVDFSGEWELAPERCQYGFLKPPKLRRDRIDHREPDLRVVTRQVDGNGDVTVERNLTIGGEAIEIAIHGRQRTIRAWWEGEDLVVETGSEVSGNARRIEDRWRMDGELLTIERFHEMPGGAARQLLVLQRRSRAMMTP
jgi:hypothetical protein